MLIVNKDRVQLSPNGDPVLSAEASDLGLAPGEWPDFIGVVDDDGDGYLFGPTRTRLGDEDLVGFEYANRTGTVRLIVFND